MPSTRETQRKPDETHSEANLMAGGGCKTGDWEKLERMLADAGGKLRKNLRAATDKAGRTIQAAIVHQIDQNKVKPPVDPASPYGQWKARHGYTQTLARTGALMKGVRYKARTGALM
jgi:hypothetical protein